MRKLSRLLGYFPKLHIKILSEEFNEKFGSENALNRQLGKSFHETIIDNCVKLILSCQQI